MNAVTNVFFVVAFFFVVTIPVWCYFVNKVRVARMEFLKGTERWPNSLLSFP